MAVVPPPGYRSVAPYLLCSDVPRLITFLAATFGGTEKERHARADGSVGHAEVQIGDSIVMMGGVPAAEATASHLYVYVEDVDAAYRRGLDAGGTSVREPENFAYGDRSGGVRDPFGNTWWIATPLD